MPAIKCRACGAPITFKSTPSGNWMPMNKDGTSHFSTCTEPDKFRKKESISRWPIQNSSDNTPADK